MKSTYKLSIPNPCHENWSDMTPNQKGRFCQYCSKTVVDFTNMKTNEIQEFIHKNKNQRICGHIRQNQLDAINLQVSDTVFEQTMSFHKLFLLALLLAMGTSLFSCADDKGNIKKIESVEVIEKVVDTAPVEMKKHNDSIITHTSKVKMDSVISKIPKPPTHVSLPSTIVVDGMITMGDIMLEDSVEKSDFKKPILWHLAEIKPNFVDTPDNLSEKEIKDYFNNRISDFVLENFKISQEYASLKGKQRIYTQFTVDEEGYVKDILVRAPHPMFEKETLRVIKLLPQFIPGKYRGKNVSITYNLPIIFNIED